MRSIRLLVFFIIFSLNAYLVQGQCTSGCTSTYSSGGSINPTANNQIICITGAGSYTYSSSYSNIHVKICAPGVTLSSFNIGSASALNNRIETWSANTTIQNVNVTADTFMLISHSTNTSVTGGSFNRKSKFITTSGADITLTSSLNPGDKVFFDIAENSTITTASVTSNQGGQIYVGKGGNFISTGTLTFQNDGELFNKGNVTIANNMTIQGGANALNNYCGNSFITIGGDFIVNTGVINNGGMIMTERILINANSGPIFMKQGSYIEANRMSNLDQLNIFRGDSIANGECATFKLNLSYASWNQAMSNSPKINYCGVVPPAGKIGTATTSCSCTSVLIGCDLQCQKPDAGIDAVYCTPLPVIDLADAIKDQIWVAAPGNPSTATIDQFTGLVSGMTSGGDYKFVLIDTIGPLSSTCTDTVTLTVVPNPNNNLLVTGGVFCSDQSNATIIIENAEPGVTYSAKNGSTTLGTIANTGSTVTTISISIPLSSIANGKTVVNVVASIPGCSDVTLTDTAAIVKNPKPSASLLATGGIFCTSQTEVTVQLANAEPGVTYQALLGSTQVGTATNTTSTAANLSITMPISSFVNGLNVVSFKALIAGCTTVDLTDTAGVRVVPNPSSTLLVTGSTVCSNQPNTIVTIANADPNVTYTALLGAINLGSNSRSTSGNLNISIPTALLANGDNTINIQATINGCAMVALLDTANIKKVPNPSAALLATGGIFCTSQTEVTVQLANAEPGVTYQALLGATLVGTATNTTATASNLSITMPISSFVNGLNVVSFKALIAGCTTVDLTDTAGVVIVPNPTSGLTIDGNIICSSSGSMTNITINSALPFVRYSAYLGSELLGSEILPGTGIGDLTIPILLSQLQPGDNIVSVKADIFGCATVELTDTANVILDPELTPGSITVSNPLVCSSSSPVLLNEVLPTGGLSPLVYNWQYSIDGNSWVDIVASNTAGPVPGVPAIAVNTQYRRIVQSKLCTATSASIAANVISSMDGGEIFTQAPNVCDSKVPAKIENGILATGGTGVLLEYQWQSSIDGISWNDISLANDSEFQPDVQLENTYYRRKAINGSSACDTSYAGPVLISVYDVLEPGSIQSGDTIVCDQSDVVIKNEIFATGGSPQYTYLWQASIAPFVTWTDISSSDVSSLNINNIGETTRFKRIVINSCGQDTTIGFYEVKVLPNLVSDIVFDTIPGLMCNTDQISITATTTDAGANRSVAWYLNNNPLLIPAGQADSVYSEQGNWNNGDVIKAIVTIEAGKLCTTMSDSTEVTLQVNYAISGNNLSGDIQKACTIADLLPIEGSTANGSLANPAYIWQISTDSIAWNDIVDANDQNYLPAISTGLAYYRRIAVSAGACGNDTSSTSFEVRLDGDFDPGTIASDKDSLCQGTSPIFTVTSPIGGLKPYTFQWESSIDNLNWLPIDLATDSNYISPELTVSTYFRRKVFTGTEYCTYNSNTVLVHVDTAVVSASNSITSDQAICEGMLPEQLTGSLPTGGLSSVAYKWIYSTDGLTGWTDIDNASDQNFQPDTLRQTTFYKRIITSTGSCANDTSATAVKIYVDPKLTSGQIVGHVGSVCQFEYAELCGDSFTGGSPIISFQWQQSIDDVNWTDIIGQTNDTLITGPLERTTNFRLILTSGLAICKDTSNTRKIVVNTAVTSGSNSIPSGQDICLGETANEIIGSVPTGGLPIKRYQWLYSVNGVDNWTLLTDSVRKDLKPGAATESIYYKRIVTSTGACANDTTAGVYRLFVDNPVNPGKLGDDQQFCGKDTLFLNQKLAASGGTYINYTWQIAADTTNAVWQNLPNFQHANLYILKEDLPDFDAYYFRRIASSQACSAISDVMGVFPCQNPELWNGYPGALCLNETLVDSIVVQKDFSKNGGGLIPRSALSLEPMHGQVTMIDTVNKVFTYKPDLGFYGRDSIGFTICDTSQFQRCSDKKIFITVLYSNNGPVVVNEYYTDYRNTNITGNILSNDSDPDNDTLYVVDPVVILPKNGNLSVDYDGNFLYMPYNGFTGRDSLVVTVCDFSSLPRCAQSICQPDTVYFNVLPNRVFVPDGFSPNNDNNHDVFVIRTDAPSKIHLAVYNRWGNVVYEDKNYNNDWSGVANRGLVIGEGVPDGTYYIYYNINDGEFEDFKFITLNR